MRYSYKVRELSEDKKVVNGDDSVYVGETQEMQAMSFKKLQRKLDPKKRYFIEYRNKKNNHVSTITKGRNNG
jgi:hypothetical protein